MGRIISPVARIADLGTFLAYSPPAGQYALSLASGGTIVRAATTPSTAYLDGRLIDLSWLSASVSAGYNVVAGSGGVTVDANGHLVCVANNANPTIRIQFPGILGARSGYASFFVKVSGGSAVTPTFGGNSWVSTRFGPRLVSSGGPVGSAAESYLYANGGFWYGAVHVTDGTSHTQDTWNPGGGYTLGSVVRVGLDVQLDDTTSVNYPTFYGNIAETLTNLIPSTGFRTSALPGVDWSIPTTETPEFVVDQGAAGADVTVTLEGIVATIQHEMAT